MAQFGNKAKVFLFHRVSPVKDPLWQPISPENFLSTIKLITKYYTVIPSYELLEVKTKKFKKPPAVITFDDGYRDFLEYALPILDKHNLHSTMFVITSCAETGIPPWSYELDFYLQNSKKKLDNATFLPESFEKGLDGIGEERLAFARQLKLWVKTISQTKRENVMSWLRSQCDDVVMIDRIMLNWDELKSLSHAGIEIGSHTHTHPLLDKIEKLDLVQMELKKSARMLNEKLGQKTKFISYPNGNYDSRTLELVTRYYEAAFTVKETTFELNQNHYTIPRITLYNERPFRTLLRTTETIQRIKKLIGR